MKTKPSISVSPLHLPMKISFSQASSKRKMGESVWAVAKRNGIKGFGEGCPRPYVTGETVATALEWLNASLPNICEASDSFASLKSWMQENEAMIDEHPAAFSAVESALLDLFAREQNMSVEALLGLPTPAGPHQYSAVLGDGGEATFSAMVDQYLKIGFTDFKVKIMGELERDNRKLDILLDKCKVAGIGQPRIRLDANNVWKTAANAIAFLEKLRPVFLAVEEPVSPKDFPALGEISQVLQKAIILDESLCNYADLKQIAQTKGQFIANIKISRVGGLVRALQLIEQLKALDMQIIIGAHVAETSIMTRAGLCASAAAGTNLLAQEGAFGLILLENEPVQPSLMFGARGRLDLSKPYVLKTPAGAVEIPVENWGHGWGLTVAQ